MWAFAQEPTFLQVLTYARSTSAGAFNCGPLQQLRRCVYLHSVGNRRDVFGGHVMCCSPVCLSWVNDAAEALSSKDMFSSVFVIWRRPTKAKKIEIRPAAAIAPAPIATVTGELLANPIIIIPAPRKAMPRTSKR